nr:caspase family protein [Desulfobacula sp.]
MPIDTGHWNKKVDNPHIERSLKMANKALLVGVNKYMLPGSDLQGCVNDITNIRDVLLKYFGFRVRIFGFWQMAGLQRRRFLIG